MVLLRVKILILFILSFLFVQCESNTSIYERFLISESSLGEIKVGQTISEARQYLSNFDTKTDYAWLFGYGGGGDIHLYYDKDELILGLIPKLESDTIHAIIVISEKFKNIEGLNTSFTFDQLEKLYPSTEIYLNEKYNWEWCLFENEKFHVVFMTEQDSRIAEYNYDENFKQKTVRIINKNEKIDWSDRIKYP